MREWNAATYHKVSDPQVEWGVPVLARLPLNGDEHVLDVGSGTGRLTEKLLERLPRGKVVAVDLSSNMLSVAHEYLRPRFQGQIAFVLADASALPFNGTADAIFSTATFHWVLDHDRLFRSLYAALRPDGRLVAQCGGGRNIERVNARCMTLMRQPGFATYFGNWSGPWNFADAETTARRLREAGFADVQTSVEYTPVLQPDALAYREFVANVVCRHHLARLPDEEQRDRFMTALTELASADETPFELDYWRLNMEGVKPMARKP
jgi:trans-aconitate methyltransferase